MQHRENTWAASALRRERKAGPGGLPDRFNVKVVALAQHVRAAFAAAVVAQVLQGGTPAWAAPVADELVKQIHLSSAGLGTAPAGAFHLSEQPSSNWVRSTVEFLSSVPPECQAVPKPEAQQKCQQRERGVLEKFHDQHPNATALLLLLVILLMGILVGIGT
jgi:hypothetical protein